MSGLLSIMDMPWASVDFANSASFSLLFSFKESPSLHLQNTQFWGHRPGEQGEHSRLSEHRNDLEMSCDPNESGESPP